MRRNAWINEGMAAGLIVAVILVAYPAVSSLLYENHKSAVYAGWQEEAAKETDTADADVERCRKYNELVRRRQIMITDREEDLSGPYHEVLQTSSGVMAWLEIPAIGALLPVYHGTAARTLDKGIGHVMESSLPVGGTGTHAVLTGHSGMSGTPMFSDLAELTEGDRFYIHLPSGDKLSYEVDQILTVLPSETDALRIDPENDYVTLVTCTPFGINTHRLLVRGKRIREATETDAVRTETDAGRTSGTDTWRARYRNAVLAGLAMPAAAFIFICVRKRRERRKHEQGGTDRARDARSGGTPHRGKRFPRVGKIFHSDQQEDKRKRSDG